MDPIDSFVYFVRSTPVLLLVFMPIIAFGWLLALGGTAKFLMQRKVPRKSYVDKRGNRVDGVWRRSLDLHLYFVGVPVGVMVAIWLVIHWQVAVMLLATALTVLAVRFFWKRPRPVVPPVEPVEWPASHYLTAFPQRPAVAPYVPSAQPQPTVTPDEFWRAPTVGQWDQ